MKGQPGGKRVDTFAHRVRWARQNNTKLSKIELAKKVGVHFLRMSAIEDGKETSIPKPLLTCLATALRTSPDWLKFGTDRRSYFKGTPPLDGTISAEIVGSTTTTEPEPESATQMITNPEPSIASPFPLDARQQQEPPVPVAIDPNTLAGRFRMARERGNLTVSMVANASGLPLQHLQRIEDGVDFSLADPFCVARALKIDVAELLAVSLAGRVRQRRVELRLTPEQLAREVGVRARAIEIVEAGQSQFPVYLAKLAAALDVDETWLRTGQGPVQRVVSADAGGQEVSFTLRDKLVAALGLPGSAAVAEKGPIPLPPANGDTSGEIAVTAEIGARVRAARQPKFGSGGALAAAINRSNWYVNHLERATGRVSRTGDLPKIAEVCGVSLDYLLFGKGEPPPPSSPTVVVVTPPRPAEEKITLTSEIGARVRALREAKGMRNGEMAKRIGHSPSYVTAIEQAAMKQTAALPAVAEALGVSLNEILNLSTVALPPTPAPPKSPTLVSPPMPSTASPAPRVTAPPQQIVVPVSDFDLRVEDGEFHALFRQRFYRISPEAEFGEAELRAFAAVSFPPRLAKVLYQVLGQGLAAYEAEIGPIVLPEQQAAE